MKKLKVLFVSLVAASALVSCSPVVYAHTENEITVTGKKFEHHHVETISLPKSKSI